MCRSGGARSDDYSLLTESLRNWPQSFLQLGKARFSLGSLGISVVHNCRTSDLPNSPVRPLIGKSGRLYIRVVVRSVGRLVVRHGGDSSDVTLAFEDAQVIQTLMDDE